MSEHSQQDSIAQSQQTRRYVRRIRGGGLPFYPFGLVPALGLFFLSLFAFFPFASFWVERVAKDSAQIAVRDGGEGWAEVTASGQWVTLKGEAPNAESAVKAVRLIRNASASTSFGKAKPVTRVIDRSEIAVATAELESIDLQEDPVDETSETTMPAPSAALPAIETVTPPATAEAEMVAVCDQSLRALLIESKLKFASSSARIENESAPLLDRLARTLQSCDLDVTIEGHTDSTGSASVNRELSLARAQAVRDALIIRGVPITQLLARGYGADRPIASNDTREGRDQNRRIEFNVRSSDDP